MLNRVSERIRGDKQYSGADFRLKSHEAHSGKVCLLLFNVLFW